MRHSRHFLSLLCRTLGVCGMLAGIGVYLPLILPALFGLETFAITTASMEPQLPEGSLVFAGEIEDPAALEAGQIVVFYSGMDSRDGMDTITHRIVSNDLARRELTTRGDANSTPDLRPVSYERLRGVVEGRIPFWGRFAVLLGSIEGKIAVIAVLFISAVLYAIGVRIDR